MADTASRTYRAIWNGAIVAESDRTVRVEGNEYFPPDAIRQEFFQSSASTSVCPWKGTAVYYDVTVDGMTNRDAAWSYPHPSALARQIRDHVAFWGGVEIKAVDPAE
jgi:uncharacterized protein (DUF427 family)